MTVVDSHPTIKVRRDLTEILTLVEQLPEQATQHARSRLMPGGTALVAGAPVSDLDDWAENLAAAELHHYATCPRRDHRDCHFADHVYDEDDQDHEAPLQTLLFWSTRVRVVLDAPLTGRRPTITSEASLLRHQLDWIWDHAVRTRLEDVVHAGRRQDRSHVHCTQPGCEKHPRLIRIHGPRWVTAWHCTSCATEIPEQRACSTCHRRYPAGPQRHCDRLPKAGADACGGRIVSTVDLDHCPAPWCWSVAPALPVHVSDPDHDWWKCPHCKHRYDDHDYQRAQAKALHSDAADRHVKVADAIDLLRAQGRGLRTIRRWLAPTRHQVDRCTTCHADHEHGRHQTCPVRHRQPDGTEHVCGGRLRTAWIGDTTVIGGYCDLATHTVWLYWPDLWRRHLTTRLHRGGQ